MDVQEVDRTVMAFDFVAYIGGSCAWQFASQFLFSLRSDTCALFSTFSVPLQLFSGFSVERVFYSSSRLRIRVSCDKILRTRASDLNCVERSFPSSCSARSQQSCDGSRRRR